MWLHCSAEQAEARLHSLSSLRLALLATPALWTSTVQRWQTVALDPAASGGAVVSVLGHTKSASGRLLPGPTAPCCRQEWVLIKGTAWQLCSLRRVSVSAGEGLCPAEIKLSLLAFLNLSSLHFWEMSIALNVTKVMPSVLFGNKIWLGHT